MFIFIVRSAVSAPIHLRTYDQHRLTAWLARHVARCTPGAIINLDNSGLGISRTDCGPLRCANGVGMVRTEPTIPSTVFQNFIILPWLGPWPGPDTAQTYWYRDRKVFVAATGASDARGEVHIRGCRQFPHSVHIGRRTCEYARAFSITHTHTYTHTHIYIVKCCIVVKTFHSSLYPHTTYPKLHTSTCTLTLHIGVHDGSGAPGTIGARGGNGTAAHPSSGREFAGQEDNDCSLRPQTHHPFGSESSGKSRVCERLSKR